MLCADELMDTKNSVHSLFVVVWGNAGISLYQNWHRYITSITHLDDIYNEVQKIGVAGLWGMYVRGLRCEKPSRYVPPMKPCTFQ